MGNLSVPVCVPTGEAVYEHDRRPAIACDDVMDQRHAYPPRFVHGLCSSLGALEEC
jgi:hypothetical protein